jgi:hypothetical protein
MRTVTLLVIIFAVGVILGLIGLGLRPLAPEYFREIAFATIVAVSTLLFGATGFVTISRAEYPLGIMFRGNAARALGLLNIAIWLFVLVASTIRFFAT